MRFKLTDRFEYHLLCITQPHSPFVRCARANTIANPDIWRDQVCVKLIKVLEALLEECLPLPKDSNLLKGQKAMKSNKAGKNSVEV